MGAFWMLRHVHTLSVTHSVTDNVTEPGAMVQDSRPALVERAIEMLASVTVIAGGSFMANRVSREAWPQLARLMADGPALATAPHAPPRDSGLSSAILQRTRHAALSCVARCALPRLPGKSLPTWALSSCRSHNLPSVGLPAVVVDNVQYSRYRG